MAGLVPDKVENIRQPGPDLPQIDGEDENVIIEDAEGPGDQQNVDTKGNIISIEHDDGSITISLDGGLGKVGHNSDDVSWFSNLAEHIEASELNAIAEDLMVLIREDVDSRKDWIEERANGIKLLGLKLEIGSSAAAGSTAGDAPVEGTAKVRHPLLLEAVLRFQANARSEILPTDGPVKIRNDEIESDAQQDELAAALEKDMNHYLTVVDADYYPDTDRMLFILGFGGSTFKKVYNCPLRGRPVSEAVDADDLIVNNSAVSLGGARRVTHRIYMKPSTVRRLQLMDVYRDIDLSTPLQADLDAVQREEREQQGIRVDTMRPDDRDREIYECYCELNLKGFEHKWKGKESGLEVPYRVTIDVSSRQILSIVRNYYDTPETLPVARQTFVEYTFVPGFGFYAIGLLNILGNTTNAITAAWRELLDAGMYSNFPGFLMSDGAGRQNTNIFRIPPGGGQMVKTNGLPIKEMVMPLPYQPPSPALMQLVDNIAETGQRVGGTSELQVGEGKQDAPVGTTLALIEQATKVMDAVHKRVHASQAREFQLLLQCFRENPESFTQIKGLPSRKKWSDEMFLRALENHCLVPQADPNTASQSQRLLKVMAVKQLQAANPTMYDPKAIDTVAIRAIGFNDPNQFFASEQAQQQPSPEMIKQQAEIEIDKEKAQATMITAQAKMAEVQAKVQQGAFAPKHDGLAGGQQGNEQPNAIDIMNAKAKMMDAETRRAQVQVTAHDAKIEDDNRDLDRASRERMHVMGLARDIYMHENAPAQPPQPKGGKKVESKKGKTDGSES